jgi:hypothetical protein
MIITNTTSPTADTGIVRGGKLDEPRLTGEFQLAQVAVPMPTTMPATGAEGGSKEIIAPKKPSIDYRPKNTPQATILLTETSIRESMQKYPNAKKANSTLIKNMQEWYADSRTKKSPLRKAVKAYIMAAASEPAKPAQKRDASGFPISGSATGGPKKPKKDGNKDEVTIPRLRDWLNGKKSEAWGDPVDTVRDLPNDGKLHRINRHPNGRGTLEEMQKEAREIFGPKDQTLPKKP